MHELGMTERLLAATLRQAAATGACRVTAVHTVADELAAVSADSLRFYWDMVSAGTIAAGARLYVEQRPARLVCQACQAAFDLSLGARQCPRCGSEQLRLAAAMDPQLESIEAEGEPAVPGVGETELAETGAP